VVSARRHELHLLTGVYAADALDAAERAEFERHLEHCRPCAEEVRGLRETAARLAMATAVTPPPGMRAQVLAATARTRPLPPPGRRLRALGGPRSLGRLRGPAMTAGVAAMAAAIAVLAYFQVSTRDQLRQAQAGSSAVAAVLAAPDARVETAATKVGGSVTAVISADRREAVITTTGMPVQSGRHVYELWVMHGSSARPAGLMNAVASGATPPVLADGVRPGDAIGVTIEPAGGSPRPTTAPVVVLPARS
jgi:anti-sigma-K factor RskA